MKTFIYILTVILISCSSNTTTQSTQNNETSELIIAFGSCNKQNLPNTLWGEISKNNPSTWIWGGDIIYADTYDMKLMQSYYNMLKNDTDYTNFRKNKDILGIWDDHDYGLNDGGEEFTKKDDAQQLFLDFFDVDANDSRRTRKGIYYSKTIPVKEKSVKIILLDTRYFRTVLTKDPTGNKRYIPTTDNNATILGETQWNWLENELNTSTADFNVIVSSIQFLSHEHGFESWGNMPLEVSKMQDLIVSSKAKRVLLLSGDRHISEISATDLNGLAYPLYDFTSSGLTHSYSSFISEPNEHRKSNVVSVKSFGILKLNLTSNIATMEIRGANNSLLESINQQY